MKRCAFALMVFFATTILVYSQARKTTRGEETWYEQALGRLNPGNVNYGSIWEQRKRAIRDQIGNPYFQYSFAATAAVVVLLTWVCIQRVSRKRALDIAALSIADILRHDEYSRQVADDAIRRYNEHIESCNRLIEAGRDSDVELQRVRKELADTRQENRGLRDTLAKKEKIIAEMASQKQSERPPAIQKDNEPTPGEYLDQINALEKQRRAERRQKQHPKGTSVNDHRA